MQPTVIFRYLNSLVRTNVVINWLIEKLHVFFLLYQVNKDEIAKWVLSFQVRPEAHGDEDNGKFP